jgi:hypothetical protein
MRAAGESSPAALPSIQIAAGATGSTCSASGSRPVNVDVVAADRTDVRVEPHPVILETALLGREVRRTDAGHPQLAAVQIVVTVAQLDQLIRSAGPAVCIHALEVTMVLVEPRLIGLQALGGHAAVLGRRTCYGKLCAVQAVLILVVALHEGAVPLSPGLRGGLLELSPLLPYRVALLAEPRQVLLGCGPALGVTDGGHPALERSEVPVEAVDARLEIGALLVDLRLGGRVVDVAVGHLGLSERSECEEPHE